MPPDCAQRLWPLPVSTVGDASGEAGLIGKRSAAGTRDALVESRIAADP